MNDKQLLVVEDNETIRGKLEAFFKGKGYRVVTVPDLPSAMATLATQSFSAVITEFLIPGGTCEAIARHVRSRPGATPTATVVLASSKQSVAAMESARSLVDAVLLKPFKALELYQTVNNLVEGASPSPTQGVAESRHIPPAQAIPIEFEPAYDAASEFQLPLEVDAVPSLRPMSHSSRFEDDSVALEIEPIPVQIEVESEPQIAASRAPSLEFDVSFDPPSDEAPIELEPLDDDLAGPPVAAAATGFDLPLEIEAPAPPIGDPDAVGALAGLPAGSAPILDGTLLETPFAHLMLTIFYGGHTGVLLLNSEGAEKRIYFVNGIPVYAESTLLSENLGQFLLSSGVITEADYRRALEWVQREGIQQGEALVRLGVFSYTDLYEHLRRQVREKVTNTFGWTNADYRFFREDAFVDSTLIFEMHPVVLIYEGIGRYLSVEVLTAEYDRYVADGAFVRRTEHFERIRSPIIELMPSIDIDVCFSGAKRVSELGALTRLAPHAIAGLLRTLLVLSAIELVATTSVAAVDRSSRDDHAVVGESFEIDEAQIVDARDVAPKSERGAIKTTDADADRLMESVTRDYLRTKTNDYYKVLGVERTATGRAIEDAYLAFAGAYHPDRFRDVETLGVRSKAKEVFLRISTAYGILSDVSARRAFDQGLSARSGEVETKDKTIAAELEFQTGERMLATRGFGEALSAFERAVTLNDKEPVYHLYCGWAMWNAHPDSDEQREKAKSLIQRGIAMNPIIDVAYYFLGMILKAEGNNAEAVDMFERALVFNPDNLDASKEIQALTGAVSAAPAEGTGSGHAADMS